MASQSIPPTRRLLLTTVSTTIHVGCGHSPLRLQSSGSCRSMPSILGRDERGSSSCVNDELCGQWGLSAFRLNCMDSAKSSRICTAPMCFRTQPQIMAKTPMCRWQIPCLRHGIEHRMPQLCHSNYLASRDIRFCQQYIEITAPKHSTSESNIWPFGHLTF